MSAQREIQAGPLLAAAGGLLLLVALFLDWYSAETEDLQLSGFTSFEVLDLVLAGLALAAVASALAGLGLPRWVPARALPVLGATAFVIVVSQLLNHPPLLTFAEAELEVGAWLALLASIAMIAGGVISVARVSLAVNVSERGPESAQPPAPPPAADTPPPASNMPPPASDVPPPAPPPSAGPDDQTQRLPGE